MELVASSAHRLKSPAFDPAGSLFCTCSTTGTLFAVNGSTLEAFLETNGAPCGLAFDPATGDAFLCDGEKQSVQKIDKDPNSDAPVVVDFIHQFEGRGLAGPQRLCFLPSGELLFTDGGALGEASPTHAAGSVYRTVQRRQQLLRLAGGLAGPSGVAVDSNTGFVYVCETPLNRVLRFVPRPEGHFVSSVWLSLQGSLGPVDVAVHPLTGDVYVAKHDVAEASPHGTIVVVSRNGEEKGHIAVPTPQINGIAVSPSGEDLFIIVEVEEGSVVSKLYRCPL
jgi:DNA-binding beta-propeller fold protein YncE